MHNLAELTLDLICTLKFAPADGYEIEDLAAMENACWQTIMHSLDDDEYAAIVSAAQQHLEELEFDPVESLPEHLQRKHAALQALIGDRDKTADTA